MIRAPRAIALGAAVLCAAAALPLPLPAAARAPLLALALGIVPGALVAPRLAPAASSGARALLALTLSPFLCAAPAALLVVSGVPVGIAARVVTAAVALAALLAAIREFGAGAGRRPGRSAAARSPAGATDGGARRSQSEPEQDAPANVPRSGPGDAPPRPSRNSDRTAWIAAAAFTAVVATFFVANPYLAPRSDGWFHAAVTFQLEGRGLPAEDPAFAGLPLLYFWGPALWCAMWLGLEPRFAVWTPWIALNLAGAFATLLGVTLLARRLGARPGAQALAAGFAVLGYAPFAWLMVAARAASGDVRGLPEVARLLTLGADPALRSLDPGVLHVSLLFFADKFLVLTPFALGLALFAAFVLALLDLAEHPGVRPGVALGVVLAATLFTHTLVGLTCGLLAGVWWTWALARAARGETEARAVLVPLALAVAAAALALSPYLLAVAAGKERVLGNGLSARALASGLLAGALFVPAGFAWLARGARSGGPARHLLPLALALAALGLGFRLPENNQSKFWNLLFLLLAAPAALAWHSGLARARGAFRGWVVAGLAVALLPTVAACVLAFACERGQNEERTHFPVPEARAAWDWARSHTARDAMFADREGASDMLVLAGRSALWGGGALERDWGHAAPALEARRLASRELCSGGALSPGARELIASLGREVIVVERAGAKAAPAAADSGGARLAPIFRNAALALYRWEGAR